MSKSFRFAFCTVLLATLAACGGGGGGGSVIAPGAAPTAGPEATFSSFSAVKPNTTTVMSGISRTGRGSASSLTLDPVSTNSTAKLNIGADGKVNGMSLLAPQSSVSFAPGSVNCRPLGACAAGDGEKTGVVLNPATLGWNYQSFGVWAVNGAPMQVGAMSAGAVTPATAVPTTGSATFTGHAGGFYFDGTGSRLTTDAQMSATANFSSRTIDFSTTGTVVSTAANPAVTSARPELNLSGNLSYGSGSSQFSGNVGTANNALSGDASGRFYGPNAQEIGGVYGLSGSNGARMVGAFGGKR
jgi:hypothetical protein